MTASGDGKRKGKRREKEKGLFVSAKGNGSAVKIEMLLLCKYFFATMLLFCFVLFFNPNFCPSFAFSVFNFEISGKITTF